MDETDGRIVFVKEIMYKPIKPEEFITSSFSKDIGYNVNMAEVLLAVEEFKLKFPDVNMTKVYLECNAEDEYSAAFVSMCYSDTIRNPQYKVLMDQYHHDLEIYNRYEKNRIAEELKKDQLQKTSNEARKEWKLQKNLTKISKSGEDVSLHQLKIRLEQNLADVKKALENIKSK